ncbi:PTS glucose transporter subunit IIA [Paenibacillus macerans]|uniref:PTS sugar transporter subunit IIA n=1 Tax=Paenibacillus macerans TaxID=44252 RepID=UPI001F0F7131|nr:PTS glucose transporter subunit IIA [Paenibacillus macerans]MEC0329278.1 PTS glucose transporter subunit IIA [Paenibacillus macerans]UMV49798.1 PTS glucose transporter subunit IIA [Paenibacillus macerans]
MFHWGRNKKALDSLEIASPIPGKAVELKEVPDPAFAQGHMGGGAAIEPAEGKVYAPFEGKIAHLMDKSKHAVIVEHRSGVQVLIHVGIDTVSLKGNGFTAHVSTGAKVKQGQLLLEFDQETIRAAGLSPLSPVIVPDGLEAVARVEIHVGQQDDGHNGPLMTVYLKS